MIPRVAILAWLLAGTAAFAQGAKQTAPNAEPPELVKLRKAQSQERQRASLAPLNSYIQALRVLKVKADKEFDLEKAAAIQDAMDKASSRLESATAAASGRVLPEERLMEFVLGRKELDNPEQTLRLEDISWGNTYSITVSRDGTFTSTGWYGSKGYWSIEDGRLTLVFDNTKESRCVMVFLTAGFSGNSLKGRISDSEKYEGTRIRLVQEK